MIDKGNPESLAYKFEIWLDKGIKSMDAIRGLQKELEATLSDVLKHFVHKVKKK